MRAKKIFYWVLTIFLLVIGFFVVGFLAPEDYQGELTGTFPDTQEDVWRNLTSIDAIPGRKPDVERITVVEDTREGAVWIEHLKNGDQRTLRVVDRDIPSYFAVERIQSNNGFTGRWEYFLSQNNEQEVTEVTIKETSKNTDVVLRAWHTILGRSINLRREVKSLRVSLFQRLLTTP